MTILHSLLNKHEKSKHATDTGTKIHTKLRRVYFDGVNWHGDNDLTIQIQKRPELNQFFSQNSHTEVPIAGHLGNRFISRRIDRLVIDNDTKKILILDYKSDIDKETNRGNYYHQLSEYRHLLHAIYPKHQISCYILWTHDFMLEKII